MAGAPNTYVVVAIVAATLIAGLIVGAQRDDSRPGRPDYSNAKVYTERIRLDRRRRRSPSAATPSYMSAAIARSPVSPAADHDDRCAGVAVLPGFNDAHAAFIAGGLAHDGVDLFDAETLDDMKARIADWADAHAETGWIVGCGLNYQRFADRADPRTTDAAVERQGRSCCSRRTDMRAWLNSAALIAGAHHSTLHDPGGGVIVRDARTGEPTGLLKDAAVSAVVHAMPPPTKEERARALRLAIRDAQEHGVTSVQDIAGSPSY